MADGHVDVAGLLLDLHTPTLGPGIESAQRSGLLDVNGLDLELVDIRAVIGVAGVFWVVGAIVGACARTAWRMNVEEGRAHGR